MRKLIGNIQFWYYYGMGNMFYIIGSWVSEKYQDYMKKSIDIDDKYKLNQWKKIKE